MDEAKSWLDGIDVAAPCPASWAGMTGDERKRFCAECKLHVYNLSDMTRNQAVRLVRKAEGKRLCVRFFRRSDGTVLTRDCPVGLRRRVANLWARCAAIAGMLLAGLTGCARKPAPEQGGGETPPEIVHPLMGEVWVPEQQEQPAEELLGDLAVPPEAIMGKFAPPEKIAPGGEDRPRPRER